MDVIVRYVADTKDLEQGLQNIERENGKVGDSAKEAGKKTQKAIDDADKSANKSVDTFKRLGSAIVAAFAVQRVISFTREMASLGVQLETTAQRMRVVFGGAARDVEKASQSMAQSLGLSVNQFNLMASQVGDVLVPLGLARDQAAKMSTEAVKLAGALSEFSAGQVDTGQAVHALIGAFTGEREALKTLGVVINEADLQARLAQKGQKNLQGQALATAKAYATFELILERSADAQTFFTQNADSAARQQAELQAQTQTLREEFAKRLSPAITSATKSLIELVKNIDPDQVIRFAKAIVSIGVGFATYKITKRIGEFAVALRTLTAPTGIGLAIGLVSSLASAFGFFKDDISGSVKELDDFNKLQNDLKTITTESEKSIDLETASLKALFEQLKKTNPESEERSKLITEINQKYGTTLQNLSDEQKFVEQIGKAYQEVVTQLKNRIRFEANREKLTKLLQEQIKLEDQLKSITGEGEEDIFKRIKAQERLNNLNEVTRNEEQKIIDKLQNQIDSINKQVDGILSQNELLTGIKPPPTIPPVVPKKPKVKQEIETQDEINEVIRKANEKMFKTSLEATTDFYKRQRIQILEDETLTQDERIKKLTDLENQYFEDRIEVYQAFAMDTLELELMMAEKIDEERRKLFEKEKERKDKEVEKTKETEKLKREAMLQTQQAIVNTANIILDLGQKVADDALGLAVFQVLLNKAVAFSEAIKAAVSAAAATGPAAPVVTPLLIAQLTGIVFSAFGETQNLINQAEQARSSARRFARGGIMIEGDGSSTGDGIHALISPRESIINANATRRHYEELLAINSGTFDKLVNAKYILPALKNQKQNIIVDAGFSDERLYGQLKRSSLEERKRHKEVLKALNHKVTRRKQM